nr:MAG TPA: hypothetical protein [Caudoviricetes sp.]
MYNMIINYNTITRNAGVYRVRARLTTPQKPSNS